MQKDEISYRYNDSGEIIKKGDLILLDGHPGRIEDVYMPGSRLAEDYDCEETGGLMILYDDGVLAVHPFGYSHRITRRTTAKTQ